MNRNNKLQNIHELKVQLTKQLRVALQGEEHEEKSTSSSTEGGESSCRHLALALAQTAWPSEDMK